YGVAVRGEHERVAVGSAFRDGRGPRQTRPILYNRLLLPRIGELVGENAGEPIRDAARRKWNNDADDLIGITLRQRSWGGQRHEDKQKNQLENSHSCSFR